MNEEGDQQGETEMEVSSTVLVSVTEGADPSTALDAATGYVPLAPPRRESGEYSGLMEMVAGRDGPEALEMLERLVALKERAEDRDAEREINHAIAAFKAQCPPIPKDGKVDYKSKTGRQIKFSHSKLSTICKVIDPHLVVNGLSYTWDNKPADGGGLGRVTICRLRHVGGAERIATFHAPPSGLETSSDVQRVGAALMYGQRYSLIQVLGLVTTLDDVDGEGPDQPQDQGPKITDEHLATLMEWIESTGADGEKVRKFYRVESLALLPDAQYEDVLRNIKAVGEARAEKEAGNAGT